MIVPERVAARAISKYVVDENGCWISGYATGASGYAQIGWSENGRNRTALVHRVSWEAANGPIPSGLTVDHICKVKRCLNPVHLRLLTRFDNARRGGRDWPLGECANGHDDKWMRQVGNRSLRNCEMCRREWARENRRRALERGLPPGDPRHGTSNGYTTYGCRCEPCRSARREYRKRDAVEIEKRS